MDRQTIEVYEATAAMRCAHYRLILPGELLEFALPFFHERQPTADVGCGSGRDVVWLNRRGFPTIGYDASPAMCAEARAAYPDIDVRDASLPELASIPDGSYSNLLCSAVLMHLPLPAASQALAQLARVLRPGGRLLLSYRSSAVAAEREPDGRLFTPLPLAMVQHDLIAAGFQIQQARQQADSYRSRVQWTIVLAEKGASAAVA